MSDRSVPVRVAFPPNWPARIGLAALAVYVVYASHIIDLTWARFLTGLDQGARFLARMFPPDVAPDKLFLLYNGMIESLQMRSAFYVVVLIAIVWSMRTIETIPEFLYDAPQQTADLFTRMWPIDWAWYPKVVHAALMETLHIATLGTILAVAMAAPVALMVARNVNRSTILQTIGRFILVATRSVHAMVWALFFVAVFGPGALAGTLAIAVHSIGFTGKFLSEAIEEAKPGPIEALKATGAPPLAVLIKGVWPQVKPAFLAISMFRWDINVRESAVLGLVGGGGLGMALDTALSNLYWDQAGLVLCVVFAVVIATEIVTSWVRSRII